MLAAPARSSITRRQLLATLAGAAASIGLAACRAGEPGSSSTATSSLPASAPLPTAVPAGTQLVIAGPDKQLQLQLSGLGERLPFKVPDWPNISDGPAVINAFRAHSLDVASNAGIPPIQAQYQGGLDARIVAVQVKPTPTYVFATRPHTDIQSVADFRNKSLAFSQGQAQGIVLLRALKEAGLSYAGSSPDVKLVPLTSPQFLTALQAGQVDVAPLSITNVDQYLNQYAKDGAKKITTDAVDLLTVLWSPGAVLADTAKVAAIAAFIPLWAKGLVWAYENPDTWIQEWYVKNQGVDEAQARDIVALSPKPVFPLSWDEASSWEQTTIQLLNEGTFIDQVFSADILFDRRFEALAGSAVDATYQN